MEFPFNGALRFLQRKRQPDSKQCALLKLVNLLNEFFQLSHKAKPSRAEARSKGLDAMHPVVGIEPKLVKSFLLICPDETSLAFGQLASGVVDDLDVVALGQRWRVVALISNEWP
jgi:hypothetical protein